MKSSEEKNELKIFREQLEKELKKLRREEIIRFARLCALRALPYIGAKGNFNFWKKRDRHKKLFYIFNAIDFSTFASYSTSASLFLYADSCAESALAVADSVVDDNAFHAFYAIAYAATTFRASSRSSAAAAAAFAAAFADSAFRVASTVNNLTTYRQMILEGLQHGDPSVGGFGIEFYGSAWNNFQKALNENDCGYWARWYQKIFEKGLVHEKEDVAEIKMRLQVPENISEQGAAAVGRYMEQLTSQGKENLYEARIVIVGEPGAGKTTLFRKLNDENIPVPDPDQKSTHGISINQERIFNHKNRENIKASIWDFGGQVTQNYLHQYFYAKDNLFVLVCDQRAEKTRFDYWFEMITRLCAESRIIVVKNMNERVTASQSLNLKEYEERFPGIRVSQVDVDLKINDAHWSLLIQTIEENLSLMERVNQEIPKTWKPIRETIQKLKEEKRCHISFEEFQYICSKNGLPEEDYQNQCLDYLHWLGYALHYSDPSLTNTIFINPEWITTGLYEILREENYKPEWKGRFSQEDIQSIWKGKQYTPTDRNHLLNLLLKDRFEVCYKVEGSDNYLVPILISNEQKEPTRPEGKPYTLRFKFPFIPFGFFSRLIVRLYDKIWDDYVWLTGVWLKDKNNCMARMEHFKDINTGEEVFEITIYGEKKERKELLSEIRNEIFHSRKLLFPNLIIEEQIPCNCEKCSNLKTPYFHSRKDLEKMAEQNQFYSQCKESGKLIPTGQLLDSIIDTDELKRQYKEMGKEGTNIHIHDIGKSEVHVDANAQAKATAKATNTVTITINNILGEVQNLKEDFEDEKKLILKGGVNEDDYDVTLKDIGKAETAIQELEAAQQQNQTLPEKSKSRLKRFINDLSDEKSTLHKGLKLLRKGKEYGVNLAELYNKVAANTGMPLVPPLALEVIKKL